MKYFFIFFFFGYFIFSELVFADTPLAPPTKHRVCSENQKICADSDPAKNNTIVTHQKTNKVLSSIPGWHRWLFVSNDGQSVVAGYDGMNLVPEDVSLQEPVFFIYYHGKLIRTILLGDLYQNKSELRKTVSNYAWVLGVGFNKQNQFVVERISGDKITLDPKSGRVQKNKSIKIQ